MDINVVVASRPNRPPEQDLLKPVNADRLGYGVRLRARGPPTGRPIAVSLAIPAETDLSVLAATGDRV